MNRQNRSKTDRSLWGVFAVLFAGMVATVWLPVEPIVWGVPFWAAIALTLMLTSVVAAGFAGLYGGWPGESR